MVADYNHAVLARLRIALTKWEVREREFAATQPRVHRRRSSRVIAIPDADGGKTTQFTKQKVVKVLL